MTKRRIAAEPRKFWTAAEDEILRQRVPNEPTHVVATALGRSLSGTYQRVLTLGIKKSAAYLASPASGRTNGRQGIDTRFVKGHASFNKGKKRLPHWKAIPPDTQFKKGHLGGIAAENYRPAGSERISKDGYLERKMRDDVPEAATPKEAARLRQRRWRAVHLIVWEEANGPLPKGYAVCFRDGNKRHITLDNLELVKRSDLMKRNTIHNLPSELKETVQLLGRVNRQIRKRERNGQEQDHRPA